MNLILLKQDQLRGHQTAVISGEHHQHLVKILKAQVGDTLKVGLEQGNKGVGTILAIEAETTTLQCQLDDMAPAKLPLTLILALPRPKMARRIIRASAELGIQHLVLTNSYKVEKSYWQSPLLTEAKIQGYFHEALEQAGDTTAPTLQIETRFKPFVEDRLPALIDGTSALLCHPYANEELRRFSKTDSDNNKPITLAIGPEGGFTEYEVSKLEQAGFQAVTMGSRILKTETAVVAAISKLF